MDPAMKQLLDTLNARFDDFDRRLDDRDRVFADRTGVVDSRFVTLENAISTQTTGLERRLSSIESRLPDSSSASVEKRLADLEVTNSARLSDYSQRLSSLEDNRVSAVKLMADPRIAAIEKVTADLASWRPGVDGVLDDIHKDVTRLVHSLDRQVFDEMSHRPASFAVPTTATASASLAAGSAAPRAPCRSDYTGCWVRSRSDLDSPPGQWYVSFPFLCSSFF
jgi:hypothetical protein